MPVLEEKVDATVSNKESSNYFRQKQRRRMLISLAILLVALAIVAVKDRDFWAEYIFPPDTTTTSQSDTSDESSTEITLQAPTAITPAHPAAKTKSKPSTPTAETQEGTGPMVTATSRAVLPPLQVEVVAGDHRQTVHAGSGAVKVNMQPSTPATTESSSGVSSSSTLSSSGVSSRTTPSSSSQVASNASQATVVAADRVRISPGAAEVIAHPVRPNYPLLARQMKVEGAVILQALIGKQGTIQDLRVISGPAILSAAARQAVMQWHFKPYFQDGQAVETEARITVNFTISTN